ncbi:hypothetical protein [Iodidimonas sp. SYSU 1G8]|uniref:hypothetical protein n=1 Tax=Iodidimonas sp. SYSU 1G8 TaxID=3133967 RepID=UPI0031FF092B
MIRPMVCAALMSLVALPAAAQSSAPLCKGSPKVVGECFTFYGRMTVHSGAPALRIWPTGTKRLLGVADTDNSPETVAVPEDLQALLATDPAEINGKFEVCPLDAARPNRLTTVCLESATSLKAVPKAPTP